MFWIVLEFFYQKKYFWWPVVFFQIFYHDWFSVGVYNNVSIVIYISEENYVQLNVQKEMNKS